MCSQNGPFPVTMLPVAGNGEGPRAAIQPCWCADSGPEGALQGWDVFRAPWPEPTDMSGRAPEGGGRIRRCVR